MPSLKEGWGLAVVEAAGHETPTVAFRSAGGVADSVVDGETGLLVDDADQFAGELERLLRRPELRRSLGRAARAHASRFTWAASAAESVPGYLGAMRRAASRRTTSPLR